MKKSRKIWSLLLAALMILSATGCGPSEGSGNQMWDSPDTGAQVQSTEGTEATTDPSEGSGTAPSSVPSLPATVPSKPEATEPSVTEPPATEPTQPVVMQPPATESMETVQPDPTEPLETVHVHSYVENFIPSVCCKWAAYRYTCSCGDSYTVEDTSVPPNDHTYSFVRTPTEDFWMDHMVAACTTCGYSYECEVQANEINPAIIDRIEEQTIYWVNQFRLGEGTPACEAPPVFQQVADYRAKQLLDNFAHDDQDLREACAAYEYGEHKTPAGWDSSEYYYTFGGAEAIAKGFKGDDIDDTAQYFAELIYNSKGHWAYVGSPDKITIAVGIAYEPGAALVGVIFVSGENYG